MSLVGVDEFLADGESEGPGEVPGGDFRVYDEADLDVKFIIALILQNHNLKHIACIPHFFACIRESPLEITYSRKPCRGNFIRAGIFITNVDDSHSARLWYPPNMQTALLSCQKKNKRFAIANFGLFVGNQARRGHANALIFDLEKRTIERFEPTGKQGDDRTVRHLFQKHFEGWRYTLRSPTVQTPQTDSYSGMCVTFSIMFILLRILNPNASAARIQHHMTRAGDLRSRILRLNRFVINTLKLYERGEIVRRGGYLVIAPPPMVLLRRSKSN